MPAHVRPFMEAHPSACPSRIVGQLKGLTSRGLLAKFPHLRSRLPTLWSRSCFATTAGALAAETVRRYADTQNERPWRKERTG